RAFRADVANRWSANEALPVALDPDGKTLVLPSQVYDRFTKDWSAIRVDVKTGQTRTIFSGHSRPLRCVAFTPDIRRLVTLGDDQTTKVWDLEAEPEYSTLIGHKGSVYFAGFASDGRTLATAGKDQTVKLWDVASGQELATLRGHAEPVFSV